MQTPPSTAPDHRPPFRRRHRRETVVLALGALLAVAALLVGLRAWTDHQLDAPIAPEYVHLLSELSQQSPQAQAYHAAYLHHFGRDTVASRHFEQVCATMLHMAEADGGAVPADALTMAEGCRERFAYFGGGALPRD